MLSRLPRNNNQVIQEVSEPDITDKTFEINMIDTSKIEVKQVKWPSNENLALEFSEVEVGIPGYDMSKEQCKDEELAKIYTQISSMTAPPSVRGKYILVISTY